MTTRVISTPSQQSVTLSLSRSGLKGTACVRLVTARNGVALGFERTRMSFARCALLAAGLGIQTRTYLINPVWHRESLTNRRLGPTTPGNCQDRRGKRSITPNSSKPIATWNPLVAVSLFRVLRLDLRVPPLFFPPSGRDAHQPQKGLREWNRPT
jgi:hypothetical protein